MPNCSPEHPAVWQSDYPPFEIKCAAWLRDVAIGVDELVQKDASMARFRSMVKQWAREHVQEGGPVPEFLPPYTMTLPEKYARLAAIHDHVCADSKRIDPWNTDQSREYECSRDLDECKAGTPYEVLLPKFRDLTFGDREAIERALKDVEAECHGKSKAGTDDVGGTARAEANDVASPPVPQNPMAMGVAIDLYCATRSTLQRAVGSGKLNSYRPVDAPKNAEHIFDEEELSGLYIRRESHRSR